MQRKLILLFFLSFLPKTAYPEYRVYQYFVKTKIQNLTNVNSEIVTSTLNPVSYVAYHGGKSSLEINLLRSWQCMGDTSKQQVCGLSDGKELDVQNQVKLP